MAKPRRNAGATSAVRLAELALFAPQVAANRIARMALAGPTPNARDRKEFMGMVVEKHVAFAQAWVGMFAAGAQMQQQLALSVLKGATLSHQAARIKVGATRIANSAIAPVHRKAAANAKRLARTPLR